MTDAQLLLIVYAIAVAGLVGQFVSTRRSELKLFRPEE